MGVASCKSVIGQGGRGRVETNRHRSRTEIERAKRFLAQATRRARAAAFSGQGFRVVLHRRPRPPAYHTCRIYSKCSLDGELNWVTRTFTGEPVGDDPQGAIR